MGIETNILGYLGMNNNISPTQNKRTVSNGSASYTNAASAKSASDTVEIGSGLFAGTAAPAARQSFNPAIADLSLEEARSSFKNPDIFKTLASAQELVL